MKHLVFTSAGDNTNFDSLWITDDQPYDIYVVYYGDSEEVWNRYRDRVKYAERRKGSKFQNFYHVYSQQTELITEYDYVFILDDDIVIRPKDIAAMFDIAERYGLLICQPSFSKSSFVSHPITKQNRGVILDYTNFVEVNVPLYSREALAKLMSVYDTSLIGWGVDYLSVFANGIAHKDKYAIVHSIGCSNPSLEDKGLVDRELELIPDWDRREDLWLDYASKHNFYSYPLTSHKRLYRPDREIWLENLLLLIEIPLKQLASKATIGTLVPIGYLECFARIFAGIAPWIAAEPDSDAERIRSLVVDSFEPIIEWLDSELGVFDKEQAVIECGHIAYGFMLGDLKIWNLLSERLKARIIEIFRRVRLLILPYHLGCNWYLCHGLIEIFFRSVDVPYNEGFLSDMICEVETWYCGDGFYFDGQRRFKMDYYNSYVIQPFYLEILKRLESPLLPKAIERSLRYCEFLERIIAHDGTFPPCGRSITYRFAAFHLLGYSLYNSRLSGEHTYGQLRSALTRVLRNIMSDDIYDQEGMITVGFTGAQPEIGDYYTNEGSCYATTLGFLVMGLPVDHAFWTSEEGPWTQLLAWDQRKSFKKYGYVQEFA